MAAILPVEKKTHYVPGGLQMHQYNSVRPGTKEGNRGFIPQSLIAVALLLVMLFQSAGMLVIFKVQQLRIREVIKQRIKAGVPAAELVLLEIPKSFEEGPHSAFQRIHEGEFRFYGKMYDIVRKVERGGTTLYYCIADEKETQLFANLDELVKQEWGQSPARQKQNEELLRLLDSLFFSYTENFYFIASTREAELTTPTVMLKTWIFTPPTPPPEV